MKNASLTTLEIREVNFELTTTRPLGGGTSSEAVALATLQTLHDSWDFNHTDSFAGPVEDGHFDVLDLETGTLVSQVFIATVTA